MIETRALGRTDYATTWRAMQAYTAHRTAETPDTLWLTEHPPVYTLGLNKKEVALPLRDDIPLIHTDRGGKITYHGPGQIVLYTLIDLKRRKLGVRQFVDYLEETVVETLAQYGVRAAPRREAPGVYVEEAKIASLGLRLKNGCCYHGLSLNVDMDLSPFSAIDPCGYRGLPVTQTHDLGITATEATLAQTLISALQMRMQESPLC